jgi:outer membrane protein OmpU
VEKEMKKLLIGSSALVALGALPAVAMAEAPSLSMSGAVDLAMSTGSDSNGASGVGIGTGNGSTQIIFDWAGSLDNGLSYGARLDYRFQKNDVDEQYIFLSGDWGRLHVGGDDGVIDNNVPGGESVLVGDGGFDGNNHINNPVGNANVGATLDTATDDAMKLSYYSPNFSGFSVGASYIPDVNNSASQTGSGIDNSTVNGVEGTDNPQFEGTLAYSGSFDAVGISAGIGYAYRDGGSAYEDATGLMAGATVSFAGFSAGVGYGDKGDTNCEVNANCEAGDWINFGLAYSFGPGAVSFSYALAEQDKDGNGVDQAHT